MRLLQLAVVAALAVSGPAVVSAQTSTGDGTGTTTTTGTGTTTTTTGTTTTTTTVGQTSTTSSQSSSSGSGYFHRWENQGLVSGFVGASFNNNGDTINAVSTGTTTSTDLSNSSGSSSDFGGSVGYLWHSVVGGEFLAGFTPNFEMRNSLVPTDDPTPRVSTYMFNLMGAVPIGDEARWQPYVSGGWGAVMLHNSATTSSIMTSTGSTAAFMDDESHTGGNIGVGMLAFLGNWGVRGDIRYFTAFSGNNTSTTTTGTTTGTTGTTTVTPGASATTGTGTTTATATGDNGEFELLPGLNFWRANIGLALRW